jgi:hypothetical protein
MLKRITTPIVDKDLELRFHTYANNGSVALEFWDPEEDEPYYRATVNLPQEALAPNCVWLKGWSENEGLPEAMEKAGIVRLTGRTAPTGFCHAQEAELLIGPEKIGHGRDQSQVSQTS